MDVLQLLHLLLLQGLYLDAHLLPHLDVLPLGEVLIMQDVHIGHALCLQIALELGTPASQEVVSGTQLLIGLLLGLQLPGRNLLLELMSSLIVGDLGLQLMDATL